MQRPGRGLKQLDGPFGTVVRPGIGAAFFFVEVDRAARDASVVSFGHSLRAYLRIEIARSDATAFYLRPSFDLAHEWKSGALFWGPTVALGIDFDLVDRPALATQ